MATLGPLEIDSMRALSQLAAILAIAVGAGLVQFARTLDPPLRVANPATMMRSFNESDRRMAATSSGFGAAFLTLGGLMLIVPWIDAYMKRHCASGSSETA
jgi:hypothetical protein